MPYYSVKHHPTDAKLTPQQNSLKDALIASGEEWSPTWQNILTLDPAYVAAYTKLRSAAISRKRLSRKVQELILLAIDASCTHLFSHGIRVHTEAALKAGATKQEIMETLELTSVLGVHSINLGVPLLQEVLAEVGGAPASTPELSEKQLQLKASFEKQRGYWSTSWDPVLALAPRFFEAYTEFSSVPFTHTPNNKAPALDAKTRELIYCGIDAATTHMYAAGLKIHIRNAIDNGALADEVLEVFELAALMGVHTVIKGADVLTEVSSNLGIKN